MKFDEKVELLEKMVNLLLERVGVLESRAPKTRVPKKGKRSKK